MLKRIYIKRRIVSILVAIFCMTLFSCSDNDNLGSSEPGLVTLRVTLPQDEEIDMNSPASRTGDPVPGETDESKITTLKFFIFSGGTLEEYKGISIDGFGNSSDPMWDPVAKTLRITVTQGTKDIYCLANWIDDTSGMPKIDKSNVTNIASLTGQIRTHNSGILSNPPVMTGYLQKNIQGDESEIKIQLRRQIARVELSFKLSDILSTIGTSDIKVTGVKFLKLPATSYVFPKSPISSPSGVTTWGQSSFTGATSPKLTGTATAYATRYYIPEYTPVQTNATVMVISATYNGTPTYYSVVLNPAESPKNGTYPHTPYAIERNHTYRYTLTIEGIGDANVPTRSIASERTNITYELEIKEAI